MRDMESTTHVSGVQSQGSFQRGTRRNDDEFHSPVESAIDNHSVVRLAAVKSYFHDRVRE